MGSPRPTPSVQPPIDLAVNILKSGFPSPSASVNSDSQSLYSAIDGRVWLFPDIPNGWSTAGSKNASDWYSVDFGRPTRTNSAELYFFADGSRFRAPLKYRVQYWNEEKWRDVPSEQSFPRRPITNGRNLVVWNALKTEKLRVLLSCPASGAIELVEIKAF